MRELPYHGAGSENRNQLTELSSRKKERLVSTERLILTFSGEVWYAGVAIPGTGCKNGDKGKIQEKGEVSQHREVDSDLQWRGLVYARVAVP
jgi:hypothetical protein